MNNIWFSFVFKVTKFYRNNLEFLKKIKKTRKLKINIQSGREKKLSRKIPWKEFFKNSKKLSLINVFLKGIKKTEYKKTFKAPWDV